MPKRAEITPRPNLTRYEYGTTIHYECSERYYFDYPIPEDFISFYYTDNVNIIDIKCTEHSNWEVKGGLEGLTCPDPIEVDSDDNTTTIFRLGCPQLWNLLGVQGRIFNPNYWDRGIRGWPENESLPWRLLVPM